MKVRSTLWWCTYLRRVIAMQCNATRGDGGNDDNDVQHQRVWTRYCCTDLAKYLFFSVSLVEPPLSRLFYIRRFFFVRLISFYLIFYFCINCIEFLHWILYTARYTLCQRCAIRWSVLLHHKSSAAVEWWQKKRRYQAVFMLASLRCTLNAIVHIFYFYILLEIAIFLRPLNCTLRRGLQSYTTNNRKSTSMLCKYCRSQFYTFLFSFCVFLTFIFNFILLWITWKK